MKLKEKNEGMDSPQPTQEMAPETNAKNEGLKRRVCTLSDRTIDLLLRQLSHELYNHNLYRSFANYYGINGLAVLEAYYIKRAEEEKLHHDWIINYLNYNDAAVLYPEVPEIKEDWDDPVTPFKMTVDKEIETTNLIKEMVDNSFAERDWFTFAWLMGNSPVEGKLLPEQVEEESISRTALDIAESEGSWLRKEKSIYSAYVGDDD